MEKEISSIFDSFNDNEKYNHFVRKIDPIDRKKLMDYLEEILQTIPKKEKFVAFLLSYLFEDSNEYSEVFLSFIEQTGYYHNYLDIVRISAISDKKRSLSLVKHLLPKGKNPGFASGLLLAWIMEEDQNAQLFFLKCFSSDKKYENHCAIRTLDLLLSHQVWFKDTKKMLNLAKKIPSNYFEINPFSCFWILQQGYALDPNSFEPIIIQKIEDMGIAGARTYVNVIQFGKIFSVCALKKAITILDPIEPYSYTLESAIVKLYHEDPNFVIDIFRERLHKIPGLYLIEDSFLAEIVKIDNNPLVKLIESEIDLNNPKTLEIGEDLLIKCFLTHKECISWCENNYDDQRKQELIIRVLREILSCELKNHEDSSNEDAIKLTRKIAGSHGIDYEKHTKHIQNDKKGHHQEIIKALSILEKIQEAMETPPLDIDQLKKNLEYVPNIVKVLGKEWFFSEAQLAEPHFFVYYFSEKPSAGENLTIYQKYWENVFSILNQAKIPISKKKLRDHDNALNILTECEIFAKICPYFQIIPEPLIPELGNSRLEALIEWNGESALIEIRTVHSSREMNLSRGGITIMGPRVKGIICEKFRKQLKEGKQNPKIPVLLILFFTSPIEYKFAEESIYGQLTISSRIEGANKVVEDGVKRSDNGFFALEGSQVISSIAKCQKISWNHKSPFQGRLLRPNRSPQNKISQEFWVRFRDALYASNVDVDVSSLQKIHGIGSKTAQRLYQCGIEDILAFVLINPNDFSIPGISTNRLSSWQKEGRRILSAKSSGSIKYLKKMNKKTYDILCKEEIFLIKHLSKIKKPPKGISLKTWKWLQDDAKNILKNNL